MFSSFHKKHFVFGKQLCIQAPVQQFKMKKQQEKEPELKIDLRIIETKMVKKD